MPDDLHDLGEELRRELPAGHPLECQDLAALARSERRDDGLFHDGRGCVLAHLTWSAYNALPFPLFEVVRGFSFSEFHGWGIQIRPEGLSRAT